MQLTSVCGSRLVFQVPRGQETVSCFNISGWECQRDLGRALESLLLSPSIAALCLMVLVGRARLERERDEA